MAISAKSEEFYRAVDIRLSDSGLALAIIRHPNAAGKHDYYLMDRLDCCS